MEIKNCKYRLRCEMGACGKRAQYTICPARVGIRSSIHICGDCLAEIVTAGKKLTRGSGETDTATTNLAASGAQKAPKRKSKQACGDTPTGGESTAAEDKGAESGPENVLQTPAGLLRCARNDGRAMSSNSGEGE